MVACNLSVYINIILFLHTHTHTLTIRLCSFMMWFQCVDFHCTCTVEQKFYVQTIGWLKLPKSSHGWEFFINFIYFLKHM